MNKNTLPAKKHEFKSIRGVSKRVQVIFIISAILALIAIVSGYFQSQLLNTSLNGALITEEETLVNDLREGVVGLLQTLFLICGIIVFLIWINRANKNIVSFGKPRLNISSGWAVGWFFIPVASLFKPYQAVAEIAKASNPEIDPNLLLVDDLKTPTIIKWWWTFFLISNFLGNLAFRFFLRTDALTSTYAYMVYDAANVIGLIVTVIMVRQISQSQEMRFEKLSKVNVIGT